MFRKENGVTLVALVITIIVLLILAGVTISMVLGEDGIIAQATSASEAQSRANVVDQVSVAYATVRTEDVARKAGVSSSDYADVTVDYANGIAAELHKSKAFDSVKVSGNTIVVKTSGDQYYTIEVDTTNTTSPYDVSNAEDAEDSTFASVTALSDTTATY